MGQERKSNMHGLLCQVLSQRDLSKAGDLFSVDDNIIVQDLSLMVAKIQDIASASDYRDNDNDQSVVEICIARIILAIRETGSIEQHAYALVQLLESCLSYNLKPTQRDVDPPHAKIAADVISCIFRNYTKKDVMKLSVPIAVKFLHKGNKELSRNLSSYLQLAALNHADLLAMHIQPIIDSIIAGNYTLARVLPQIYFVNKESIHDHVMALVSLLPCCDDPEKLSLLNLFGLIAKNASLLLEPSVPQLCECLSSATLAAPTLNIFIQMATVKAQPFIEHLQRMKATAEQQPTTAILVVRIVGAVGRLNQEKCRESLEYLIQQLLKVDNATMDVVLKEIKAMCDAYPVFLRLHINDLVKYADSSSNTARVIIQQLKHDYHILNAKNNPNTAIQNSPGVTVVKVGGSRQDLNHGPSIPPHHQQPTKMKTVLTGSRPALFNPNSADNSRSMTRLPSTVAMNKSTNRLGSSSGIHTSMTRLGPNQAIYRSGNLAGSRHNIHITRICSGTVTVTTNAATVSPTKSMSGSLSVFRGEDIVNGSPMFSSNGPCETMASTHSVSPMYTVPPTNIGFVPFGPQAHPHHYHHNHGTPFYLHSMSTPGTTPTPTPTTPVMPLVFGHASPTQSLGPSTASMALMMGSGFVHMPNTSSAQQTMPQTRNANTNTSTLTIPGFSLSPSPTPTPNPITKSPSKASFVDVQPQDAFEEELARKLSPMATQRISVFEPYPMRDAVQHFCEKHLDKIRSYMQRIFVKIPLPVKCSIEERQAKKHAKLCFTCQEKGEHCLYNCTFFTVKTRNPRIWIHLMFLALQARSPNALSTRESSVSSLKMCWDILKADNKNFLTVVTSAFPSSKDQEILIHELRNSGYFDVFEYNGPQNQWGCFLCNHPDRALGFLQDAEPVIEGQLKEKKRKWKIFKRWRTRYFTLSGAHLSYRGNKDEDMQPINLNQITSVKAIGSRGARRIPKAFEIFTNDKTYVLKAKDSKDTEQWVQCLSIAVAHTHSREICH